MQTLNQQAWRRHFTELRAAVQAQFPQVDPLDIERVNDDWDALVEALQDGTGMDADRILDRLQAVEHRDLGIGPGGIDDEDQGGNGSVERLMLGQGFSADERPWIVERLEKLNRQLKRYPADDVWLELTVKDRDTPAMVVTLSAELPGLGSVVTSSKANDLPAAIADVRDDMVDRIRDSVEKRSRGAR
jgi:ribosome-associated translation inhibitor RaiA